MKKTILSIGILFAANIIFAGQLQTVTVSNALALAVRNNLQLKQAGEDIKIAEAQLGQSLADYAIPKVTASGSLTFLDPLSVQDGVISSYSFTPPMTLVPVNYTNVFSDNYSAGISVTKTIFNGFKLWNSMRVKQINLEIAKNKFEDKKKDVIYNTLYSFYSLFLLKENISLAEDQNGSLSNQMRNIQMNYETGSATEYDRVRVRVLYQNNQPRILSARNAYRTTKISLCDSLGLKDYDNVEFIGQISDFTNFIVSGMNATNAVDLALSNDINLKTLDQTIEIQKLQRDISDASHYPILSASFSFKDDFKKENMTNSDRSWVPSWNAGLQLSIPVDDWLPFSKTANAVSEAEANLRKNIEARQQMVDSLSLQVRSLLLQLDVAKITLDGQKEGLKQAKLGLQIANERYAVGSANVSEIIDSEFSYTQAQLGYLQSLFDYCNSILKLNRLIGG